MGTMEQQFTYDVRMFKDTFENEFTYINGFMRNVHRFAGRPALTDPVRERTWTYAQLNGEVNRLAHALLGDGVGKNEVIVYQLLNSAEFVFSYLAPQKIGAINCPINFKLSPEKPRSSSMTASLPSTSTMRKSRKQPSRRLRWPNTAPAGS